jgi:hypothetical protein
VNGLHAGMSAPPLMAAARVAAGVTSLTRQEPTFTGLSRIVAVDPLPTIVSLKRKDGPCP